MMPRLNKRQVELVAEFVKDLGLVSIASLVIPSLTGAKNLDTVELVVGIAVTSACLVFSITILAKRGRA